MNKYLKMKFALALFILFVLPIASAFANTFLEDKTMQLYKGETGEYCIYLQNTGKEDLVHVIHLYKGRDYIQNLNEIEKEFSVPVGTVSDDLPVCMKLKLPRNAEKGEKYEISYGVVGLPSAEEKGMVSLAPVQIRENFHITERLDKRPVSIITYIILVFVVLALSGIIIGYRYSRRNKSAKEEKMKKRCKECGRKICFNCGGCIRCGSCKCK